MDSPQISTSDEVEYYTKKLREFMFERVYLNKNAKSEEEKAKYVITELYDYYLSHSDKVSSLDRKIYEEKNLSREDMICDYIAGMTDRYAINLFYNIFIPKPWEKY